MYALVLRDPNDDERGILIRTYKDKAVAEYARDHDAYYKPSELTVASINIDTWKCWYGTPKPKGKSNE